MTEWSKPRVRVWRNTFDVAMWTISSSRLLPLGPHIASSGGSTIPQAINNLAQLMGKL